MSGIMTKRILVIVPVMVTLLIILGAGLLFAHNLVATPTFSPSSGTYASTQNVTITCSTGGATIRYTTDGSNPTTTSPIYSCPIVVSNTTTIKAFATKSGMSSSSVATSTYTIKVATPTFSPAAGTYTSTQSVTISCATSGATIRYTTDGSTPTTSSPVYSSPISVSANVTIKAFATKSGMSNSDVATAAYTIQKKVATPTFSPAAGTYNSTQSVTISCATSGATIRYTTDASAPTTSSPVYSAPISVSVNATINAFATKSGMSNSDVATAAYTIQQKVATPTFSPAAGTYTSALSVTISCATSGATIRYTTNGSTPTTSSSKYSSPINVSTNMTIKAIAIKNGLNNSDIAVAAFSLKVDTLSFSPAVGVYTIPQSVIISCATSGATIRYTTDGSLPTSSSMVYSSPINVGVNTTIKAYATKSGMTDSDVISAEYIIRQKVATPTFSIPSGAYASARNVSISCATNGATIHYTIDGSMPNISSAVYNSPINVSANMTIKVFATKSGMMDSDIASASYMTMPPPDPAAIAPPLDNTVTTNTYAATKFLYAGDNPVQVGIDPETIVPLRAAVIRGKVLKSNDDPLQGVIVSVVQHPEYGQTISRSDGMFDLAVNGGGVLAIKYELAGYLSAQRQIEVPWQDYARAPEVVLIQPDSQVTPITTNSSQAQIACAGLVTDQDGLRQATLFIPENTQITGADSNTYHIRATEFTVGNYGPKAMPAPLPATSAYTYCVDLSADETNNIQFSQPIYFYVENFLNFPIGITVPTGYYDDTKAMWIPSENGLIIGIIDSVDGIANIDVDGIGQAADNVTLANLGFTDAERRQLASLYQPGQSVWRVPIKHFSKWDCNWGFSPPANATTAKQPPLTFQPQDKNIPSCGSYIETQNQILRETVPVSGTPFSLNYSSDRVPGRIAANIMIINLSGAEVPNTLKRIDLEVSVAGQLFNDSFSNQTNQKYEFSWNGKDAYGRYAQGRQCATVRIGYVYDGAYSKIDKFGYNGNGIEITGDQTRQEVILWQEYKQWIGAVNMNREGLGSWTISDHHYYDPLTKVIYLGNGDRRSAEKSNLIIKTVAGTGLEPNSGDNGPATKANVASPLGLGVGADGSIYIGCFDQFDYNNGIKIRKVSPDGIITTIVGTGRYGASGDGGPAVLATIDYPSSIAIAPDGGFYFADRYNYIIRRVSPDGIITKIAGAGVYQGAPIGSIDDNIPAIEANLEGMVVISIGPDGSIYIAQSTIPNHDFTYQFKIRRIDPTGIITTIAGWNWSEILGDGLPAKDTAIEHASGIAIGPNGEIYYAEGKSCIIRKIGLDGIVRTIAGNRTAGYSGDGGPALQAQLYGPGGIVVSKEGNIYFIDYGNNRIRCITPDGIITTIAGTGKEYVKPNYSGDGIALLTDIRPKNIALGPNGALFFVEYDNRICQISTAFPEISISDMMIPSEDGSEIYKFNANGRHLATYDLLTGLVKYSFQYDQNGYLVKIIDANANTTTIERDGNENPTAIVAPFGQRTMLSVNNDGFLEYLTNPANEITRLTYKDAGGLLQSLTDSRNGVHCFSYDNLGRLIRDEDPAGGFTQLERVETVNGFQINKTVGVDSAHVNISTYLNEVLPTGDTHWLVSGCCSGTQSDIVFGPDGKETTTYQDGTKIVSVQAPDPRFGMLAPYRKSMSITTPNGLSYNIIGVRSITLSNPDDLFSATNITNTISENGQISSSVYDATTKTITNTSPMGRKVVSTIDDKGRVIKVQAPGVAQVSFHYDSYGRLDTVTEGTGTTARVSAISYNSQGYIENTTDPMGRITRFTQYDAVGRVLQETLPDGKVINFTYDHAGNVTTLTPPSKPSHGFTYTPVNLVDTYSAPDTGTGINNLTDYGYNLKRQLTSLTRPDGISVNFDYDTNGRLFEIQLPGGTLSYVYDAAKGTLNSTIAPDNGTLTYTYDGSLPLSTTWDGQIKGNIGVTYNNDFLVTAQSVNGANSITLGYNNDGQLTSIGALTLNYDNTTGMFTGSSIGNVSDSVITRTEFGEVKDYRVKYNGNDIFGMQYTYDALGRITDKSESTNGQTHTYHYDYDLIGQLTDVKKDGALVKHYDYDSNGNRLGGTYDAQDRMTAYGGNTYLYTANGELKQKVGPTGTTNYVYDALGNLTSVTLPDGTKIDYVIDGANRRVGKKVNGVLAQGWLYQDALKPVVELDGNNNVVSRFVYGTSSIVPDYMVKGGVTYRIVSDHLGSVRMVVDVATGTVAQRIDYDEFGNVTQDTNPGFQPFGFAGGLYDRDTKFVRLGNRDYDSETGRWICKDPIGFNGMDTNLYHYCFSDPINFIDPSGLMGNGYYVNVHESGKVYIGKGNQARANVSAIEKAKIHGDPLATQFWKDAPNTAESFKGEAQAMLENGWYKGNPKFYNEINSPGLKGILGNLGGVLSFFCITAYDPKDLYYTEKDPCGRDVVKWVFPELQFLKLANTIY